MFKRESLVRYWTEEGESKDGLPLVSRGQTLARVFGFVATSGFTALASGNPLGLLAGPLLGRKVGDRVYQKITAPKPSEHDKI